MTPVIKTPDVERTARGMDELGAELTGACLGDEAGADRFLAELPPAEAPLRLKRTYRAGSRAHRRAIRRARGAAMLESGQLRELYRNRGHVDSAELSELVRRGIPPIGGGATGQQASAYMANLPSEGSYIQDPEAFAVETERNDMPLEQKAIAALGGAPIDLRIPNIGILAQVRMIVKGTVVVATAAATSNYQWPWNLLKRVTVNLQGQTSLFSCEGMDLRQRRQRFYRNPKEDVSTAPATDATTGNPNPGSIAVGSYSVVLVYDIPIVHDPYTLVAAVYAQSDAVYLNWRVQLATAAELFSANPGNATFTGNIHSTITFYDIPFQDTQNGRRVLLPDMRWLHAMISADKPFANTGDVDTELIRTAGQLLSVALYLDNGGNTQIDAATLARLTFMYGGNRTPRVFDPIEMLLEKNVQDYNGRVRPGYVILDFEVDNPRRELVYPKGVTELKVRANIPSGTTINANAHTHVVSETLFAGA